MRYRLATVRRDGAKRAAFTLVEAMMASVILAITAATATLPFAAGLMQSNAAIEMELAVQLGEAMMEEVLARPFFAPDELSPDLGPESGEATRDSFNCIDDFDGFDESSDVLRDFAANPITDDEFNGFWRNVSVAYVSFAGQTADDHDALALVTVRVYRNQRLLLTLNRLVSREY